MIELIINGTSYNFPEQGEDPPNGEEVTNWAKAVTESLNSFNSTGDILTNSFNPANNQSLIDQNVIGLSFDGNVLQGFVCEYSIYRVVKDVSDVLIEEACENGTLYGSYLTEAGTWTISQVGDNVCETEITLNITNTGQVVYKSTDWKTTPSDQHSCRMVFRARAFAKA